MTSEVIEGRSSSTPRPRRTGRRSRPPWTAARGMATSQHVHQQLRKFLQRFLRVGRSGVLSRRRAHVHCPGLDKRVGAGQLVGVAAGPHQEPAVTLGPLVPEQSSIFADCSIFPKAETVALLPCLQKSGLWVLAGLLNTGSQFLVLPPPLCQAGGAVVGPPQAASLLSLGTHRGCCCPPLYPRASLPGVFTECPLPSCTASVHGPCDGSLGSERRWSSSQHL